MCEEHNIPKVYDPASVEKKWYKFWEEHRYFHAEVEEGKEAFSIVIPPPNITGQLHMGHALDNTLQDILIRWHRMMGHNTLWMPGYDHAGLATQIKVEEVIKKEEGKTRYDLGREEFLKRVWEWKEQYGDRIINQLKHLGVSCDWERKRFTMDEGCSKAVREVFCTLFEKGLIYKGTRITNWCVNCNTALSDIEVEHKDDPGHLWYINYPVVEEEGRSLMIATTRPETLPGDTAVAVNPEDPRYGDLVGKTLRLPTTDRIIPIIADSYVDTKFGTGAVKITPSHDPNDYEMGIRHNLPSIVVIGLDGIMTKEAGKYEGMTREECRKAIVADLKADGYLVKVEEHSHAVGHCQRCGHAVESQVSTQWFVKMAPLVKAAVDCVEDGRTQFVPERFTKTYTGWMDNIRDWCISRQIWWGHRIPVWYCDDCGEMSASRTDLTVCPKCGGKHFHKESDIMDVWFDSGSSHMAVAAKRPELSWPVAMYLEGSDQHRGWFQSSLLTSVAVAGRAPYESVLTHGYVVDGDGRKMSKSVGNVIVPQDVIKQYGADIIRLWTASSDYKADIRISPKILKQLAEVYRKIRNTIRYILGNTNDFNYETDAVPFNEMLELDQWALMHLQLLKKEVTAAYESYDFHVLYHAIHNFCTVEMSSFYLDILKDRLYAYKADSKERRSAQTAMHEILMDLIVMLSPVLSFTMEEVWQFMKKPANAPESVQMLPWPEVKEEYINEELETKWDNFIEIRSEITKVLELARRNKQIGHSLDAKVELHAEGEALAILKSVEKDLATLLIVSQAVIVEGAAEGAEATGREDLKVTVAAAEGHKCERCWIYSDEVGQDAEHPTLCKRCAEAVKA